MNAFIASSDKPWVLNYGASSPMTGIKDIFPSITLSYSIISISLDSISELPKEEYPRNIL